MSEQQQQEHYFECFPYFWTPKDGQYDCVYIIKYISLYLETLLHELLVTHFDKYKYRINLNLGLTPFNNIQVPYAVILSFLLSLTFILNR